MKIFEIIEIIDLDFYPPNHNEIKENWELYYKIYLKI